METLQPPGEAEQRPPEAMRDSTGAKVANVLFFVMLAGIAVLSLYSLYLGVSAALDPDGQAAQDLEEGAQNINKATLYASSIQNLFIFGIIPVVWLLLTRVQPEEGTLRYLRMKWGPDGAKHLAQGIGLGIGLWLLLIVFTLIQLAIEGNLDAALEGNGSAESPVTERLIAAVDLPLALFIALVAGVAEEIFFRGVLQRWIGWWGQAIVFGFTHAGYGTVSQIVVPFLLGLLFGWLVHKGRPLYMVMAAHFTYNFVQLAIAALA